MKILITGASGFIGSRLVETACASLGPENVIAFSSKKVFRCPSITYSGQEFNLNPTDHALLAEVDVLIHVGAFIPKNAHDANALKECNSNIHFTERLLALPLENLKKIIYISTVDIYEPTEMLTTETTAALPGSLYGHSKLYCERMTAIFAANRQLICQILRVGHVYGPGEEKYEKFLPKTITKILAGEAVELWGDGSALRTFIYIDDVITAILRAVYLDTNIGPVNVVGRTPITIRALLDQIIEVSGREVAIISRELVGGNRHYVFDNSKLCKYLLPTETDLKIGLEVEYSYMASLL